MKKEDINFLRGLKVVKRNDLIQKSRFGLSTQEQKILMYLITKIKPEDTELELYEFSIKEFCEVCGIDGTSGKNYTDLKKTVEKMTERVIWVKLENGYETIIRWIERPYINPKDGIIKIKLDELMRPFLLHLKEQFTAYNLYYTLAMKSKYSIRLYELLKSYENLSEYIVDVAELKKMLLAENYEIYKDFRVNVIDTAIKEINEFSDITVTYETEKKGKKVDKIIFKIQSKNDTTEQLETLEKIKNRIN